MKRPHMFSVLSLNYISLLDALFRQRLRHRYVTEAKIVPVHNKTPCRDVYKIGGRNPRILNLGFRNTRVVIISA